MALLEKEPADQVVLGTFPHFFMVQTTGKGVPALPS